MVFFKVLKKGKLAFDT